MYCPDQNSKCNLMLQKATLYPWLSVYQNAAFGLRVENAKGRLKNTFTIKIGRKTFGSEVAAEKGIEIASRALNHSDTQVTRDHYIVPEDSDLDFEFEGKKTNVENIERHRFDIFKKVK